MMNWIATGILLWVCGFIPWQTQLNKATSVFPPPNYSTCDLIVDAGPDTNVCDPGGTLSLMGSITGNSVFYQWSPSNGLSNPNILNPVANITGPVTYTLTGYGIDPDNPNLVVNGDFQLGNTGFVSDYNYVSDLPGIQTEMYPEGTYTVINNPNLVHNGFSACNDHTGGGNMMVINGAASLQDIWCQTIAVIPGTYYNVSAWVASVNPASPALLQFSINGIPIGAIVNAPSTTCQWVPFNAIWNSGTNSSATICILNLNTALGGNDFAIDDISMVGLCIVEDEVDITLYEEEAPDPIFSGPVFLCEGETGMYTASFPPDPPIFSYEWFIPTGATLISGQGTPQVTVMWNDPQEASLCLMIETRCDMNEACYEVIVGTVPEVPLISGTTFLCPGETITLYTPEYDPQDTYQWFLPSEVTLISGGGTSEIEIQWAGAGEVELCVEVTNACGSTDNCTLLNLFPSYLSLFDTVLCQGTTVTINGNLYGNGVWSGTETFTSIDGCDSVVVIDISEATTLEFMFTTNLCPGDSIYLDGSFQTQEGTYVDSFNTIFGCDSLVITTVSITPFDTTWITSTTCDQAIAGTTITTYSMGNCDSTVISQVILLQADTTLISLSSCSAADTGMVMQLLSNQAGCDSLVITTVTLLPSDSILLFQTTCDPASTGVNIQNLMNQSGCDSTVVTTVSYLQSDTILVSMLTCTYADTGSTSVLLVNSAGCDSLVITTLTYAGSDTTFLSSGTCNPADSGLVVSTFINRFGCDSVVATYNTLMPDDSIFLAKTSCVEQDTGVFISHFLNRFGCDSTVTLTVLLDEYNACHLLYAISIDTPACYGDDVYLHIDFTAGEGPFRLNWVRLDQAGEIIFDSLGHFDLLWDGPPSAHLTISSPNGIEIQDTLSIPYPRQLIIDAISLQDFNGYGVPCHGDSLGQAEVIIYQSGTPPTTVEWSNGNTNPSAFNLNAGSYSVTVSDSHGCTDTASVTITEPPGYTYDLASEDITCFGLGNGSISAFNIQGGVPPFLSSLNHSLFTSNFIYPGLDPGNYNLILQDHNGCASEAFIEINEPDPWSISLGPDTMIPYGSSLALTPAISGTIPGDLQISWSDDQCENCLTRTVDITVNTQYLVTATDENGCTSQDEIRITVYIDRDLYVPNIFSPNGDQINDLFTINSGTGLQEIESLTIFDRWGNLVFQEFHFQPDDPSRSWDGRMKGKPLNPGVYAYTLTVVYKDDRRETLYGDVTLVR